MGKMISHIFCIFKKCCGVIIHSGEIIHLTFWAFHNHKKKRKAEVTLHANFSVCERQMQERCCLFSHFTEKQIMLEINRVKNNKNT